MPSTPQSGLSLQKFPGSRWIMPGIVGMDMNVVDLGRNKVLQIRRCQLSISLLEFVGEFHAAMCAGHPSLDRRWSVIVCWNRLSSSVICLTTEPLSVHLTTDPPSQTVPRFVRRDPTAAL